MRNENKKMIAKVTAVALAGALALTISPVINAGAKKKAPTLSQKSIKIQVGQKKKLKVKKNGNKITKIKWSTKNMTIAAVNKKGVVKGVASGTTDITAKVTVKAGTYTLRCKVKVEGGITENEWITAKDVSVEGGVKEKFDILNKNTDGATLDPVATLAYRIADDGTTWRVLCKQTLVLPNATAMYMIAEIKESMEGAVTLGNVYPSGIAAYPTAAETTATGAWTQCDSPKLTADEKAAFEKATAGVAGVNYKPVAKVATQVVAGINYLFICESTPVVLNPEMRYSFVYASALVDGTTSIDKVVNVDVAQDTDGGPFTSFYYRSGGYTKPDSPVVDNILKSYVEKAAADLSKDITYTPLSLLGIRENDGQDFKVFCRRTPVKAGAKSTYSILEVHAGLMGEAVLADIIDTGIEAFGTDPNAGWAESETPVIAKGEELLLTEALKSVVGMNNTPLAILGTRKMRGTDYCFITEATTVSNNPSTVTLLVYISVGEDGKAELTEAVNLLTEAAADGANSGSDAASELVGSWSYEKLFTYTFNADGTGQYDAGGQILKLTYRVDGTNLVIKFTNVSDPSEITAPFKIEGNKLLITDAAGNVLEYVKV